MAAEDRDGGERNAEELARQLKQIQADFAKLAETLKDIGLDRIGGMSEAFNDAVENASDTLHGSTAEARERGENFAADVREAITRNPFGAIAAAFGIGYLLARLTRR